MIQNTVKAAMVAAMKEKDALKVGALRGLMAAFVNDLVANKKKPTDAITDEAALAVIRREVKKRKEAADAFRSGGREGSAQKEEAERVILEAYLPAMMSADDIKKIAETKKAELGITDKKDMGRLMGALMKELSGKADGGTVKEAVDALF